MMFGQLAEEQKGKMGTSVKSGRQLLTRGEMGIECRCVFITIIIFCLSNNINTIIIIIITSVKVKVTRGEDED